MMRIYSDFDNHKFIDYIDFIDPHLNSKSCEKIVKKLSEIISEQKVRFIICDSISKEKL